MGAAPHFHRSFSESFYVLSGTVNLYNGDSWFEASVGDFLYVPAGGIHAFRNTSEGDSSMLILFAPGVAREKYFEELAAIRHSHLALSEEQWRSFLKRHDQVDISEQ